MNDQVNYAKIQRIQDDLEALTIGTFGTGFVTDAMLYESGIKATVAQHTSDLADSQTQLDDLGDIRKFGAKCDGVTDDTVAFQNAINSGNVFLPQGTILINSTLTLPENNRVTIRGCGLDKTIIKVGTTLSTLFFKGIAGIRGTTFRDFTVNGNLNLTNAFVIQTSYAMNFFRIRTTNMLGSSFLFGGSGCYFQEATIHQCNIYIEPIASRPNYGIELLQGATDNHFTDIVISNVVTAGIKDGGTHNLYNKIHVYGYPEPDYRPLYGIDSVGQTLINQFYCDCVGSIGVRLRGSYVSITNSVFYCRTQNDSFVPVQLGDGLSNITIMNNTYQGVTNSTPIQFTGTPGTDIHVIGNTSDKGQNFSGTDFGVKQFDSTATKISMFIDAMTGKYGSLLFKTGSLNRWEINKDSTSESGSNAGSSFNISRYDDSGTYLGTPISISRQNGTVSISKLWTNGTYSSPLWLGNYAVWVDTNGALRIKSSAPTSATDGTIVGTQS